MKYVRAVARILDTESPYKFRGMNLTCLKLLLECGHITFRKYSRHQVVCVPCYKDFKASLTKYNFDENGQGVLALA